MKTILVPTDFSALSLKALDFGIDLAMKANADLLILNTFVTPYEFASRLDLVLESYRKDSEKKLNALLKKLQERPNIPINRIKAFVEVGEMTSTTAKFIEKHKVDLVIMGTQGASGIKKTLIGSNTAEMLKLAPCDILAIPEKAGFEKINSFIYATDHTENDLKILKRVSAYRQYFQDASIKTLHVAKEKNFETSIRYYGYKQYLKKVEGLQNIQHHIIINKDPEAGISDFTKNRKNAILTVARHKKSIWDLMFGKSLTAKLSYHTHLPILALHI